MAPTLARIFYNLLHPFSLLALLFLFFTYNKWISSNLTPNKNLPPSPPRFPIIGNLHQLGTLPFRSLQTLSKKYGDIMLLHLGSRPTIVISSAELASKVLKTHDLIFADRPNFKIFKRVFGNGKDIASSSYGENWRKMKSICILQLLSNKKVRSYRKAREEEVALMVEKIQELRVVNLGSMFMELSNDLTCMIAFGTKYREGDGDFAKMLDEFVKLLGGYHIEDFISWLGWISKINGVYARVNYVTTTFDRYIESVLQDNSNHSTTDRDGEEHEQSVKNIVDVLLEVQRDDRLNNGILDRENIKGLILDIFAAGTETTATVLEYMMSELLLNPRVMQELQNEVSRIKRDEGPLTEDDLENMSYLRLVVKETLRLHPPAPLLLPHESNEEITINGYDIPKGSHVIVNAWAIGRNPKYWKEPERFYPERFLDSPIDFKGHDFQLIPFGSGRRICPGIAFATTIIELTIANLLHYFDWSLSGGATSESLDMMESPGLSAHMKTRLVAVASPRNNYHKIK